MSVDATTVRRIAHLARVAVADDEVEHLRGEINAILAFVEQLSEVDVAHVEPMTSVMPMAMKKRTDVVTDGGNADAVLRNDESGGELYDLRNDPHEWTNLYEADQFRRVRETLTHQLLMQLALVWGKYPHQAAHATI